MAELVTTAELVVHAVQVGSALELVVDLTGLLEVVLELEVHADQVGSAELLLAVLLAEELEEVHADQVGSAEEAVVVEEELHWAHWLSDATAEAEAAPTRAAVAMTDFILIVLGLGTRKSDCGQVLL